MTVLNPIDDNNAAYAAWFNALYNAYGAGGIVSGCSISKGTGDWDIDVTSGTIIEANTEASISSGTVTITDSSGLSSGETRITIIHADTGDNLASTDGSAASDPATPDIPSSEVLLGFVVVDNGDSTAADSDIFDVPATRQNDNVLIKDGGSHEVDAADLNATGTSGQVLKTGGSAASWAGIDTTNPSDVSGSRSFGTWEQNTTGFALVVTISFDPDSSQSGVVQGHMNSSQSDNALTGTYSSDANNSVGITMVVPDTWYYKFVDTTSSNMNLRTWTEQEIKP